MWLCAWILLYMSKPGTASIHSGNLLPSARLQSEKGPSVSGMLRWSSSPARWFWVRRPPPWRLGILWPCDWIVGCRLKASTGLVGWWLKQEAIKRKTSTMAIHPGGLFGWNVLFKLFASDLWKGTLHAFEAQVNAKSAKICSSLSRSLHMCFDRQVSPHFPKKQQNGLPKSMRILINLVHASILSG